MLQLFRKDHQLSIRRSQQLGLCYSTTWKILRNEILPLKIQLMQEMKPNAESLMNGLLVGKLVENPCL